MVDGASTSVAEVTTAPARKANWSAACAQAGLLGAVVSGMAQVGRHHIYPKDGVIQRQLKYCVAILLHDAAPSGPRITLH